VLLSQLGTFSHKSKIGSPVSFVTQDGYKIGGLVYGRGSTAVVLTHSCEARAKAMWNEVAESLASVGYMVVAYDLRGFGDSHDRSNPQEYDPAMYPKDLQAAIAFARKQGATRLVLGGGSCGGLVTVKVAASEQPAAVIVMAAPLKAWDLEVSEDEVRAINSPKLFISSENDPTTPDLLRMFDVAREPKEKKIYPSGAHATAILDTEYGDDMMQRLMDFVQTNAPVGR
jgi:alpha-beta hydrolase superfamily lysophospholipase